jgi:hypothetical protein
MSAVPLDFYCLCDPKIYNNAEIINSDLTLRVAVLTLKEKQTTKRLINQPQ